MLRQPEDQGRDLSPKALIGCASPQGRHAQFSFVVPQIRTSNVRFTRLARWHRMQHYTSAAPAPVLPQVWKSATAHLQWLRCQALVYWPSWGVPPRDFSYHWMGIMIARVFKGTQGVKRSAFRVTKFFTHRFIIRSL